MINNVKRGITEMKVHVKEYITKQYDIGITDLLNRPNLKKIIDAFEPDVIEEDSKITQIKSNSKNGIWEFIVNIVSSNGNQIANITLPAERILSDIIPNEIGKIVSISYNNAFFRVTTRITKSPNSIILSDDEILIMDK